MIDFSISIEHILLFFSIIFLISLFATKASARFGVPVLVIFLFIGMFFGADGLGFSFDNLLLAQGVGTAALCVILFSGGLDTRYEDIRPIAVQGVVLASLGVLMTAFLMGGIIYFVCQWIMPEAIRLNFIESLLLGSVMSSTDSASVFSILRSKGVSLKHKLKPLLELESGSNDPMAYMLTITLIQLINEPEETSVLMAVVFFIIQMIIGIVAGLLLGKLTVFAINKINLDNESLYSILLLTCCIFIFATTYFIQGNGFLAVYIAGLVIGNSKFVHKRSSLRFFDGMAWLSQMMMFLMLGLLVNPKQLLPLALVSSIIALGLILLARPISVFVCLLPFRKRSLSDKTFVSWVGLRGAVPIIFAILPLAAGIDKADVIFNIVFFITLISLVLQGTSIPFVAKLLHLSEDKNSQKKLQDFSLEFAEDIKSTMTEISLTESILENGNQLMSIPLPEKTLVVMVKRGDSYFIPKGNTELHENDKLLIITNDESALLETYHNLGISDYTLQRS